MPPEHGAAIGCCPGVARGDDHDNSGLHRLVDRFAQRVGGARFRHGMAERQVDDADVVARAVGDDPFDAVDDVARVAGAVGAEHPDVDEVRAGRDAAGILRRDAAGRRRVAGDDPGDVRAVTVRIGGLRDRR